MTKTKGEYYGPIIGRATITLILSLIVLMITLLALTVNIPVEQDEYAVGYNTYKMEFTEIYEQGKHTVAVGEEFYYVGRTQQTFEDNFQCLTKDKILINLDVDTHYTYIKDDLIKVMFRQFKNKDNYNKMLHDKVVTSIIESCLLFEAIDYYDNRALVSSTMYSEIDTNINNAPNIGAIIEFIRLTNIEFPETYNLVIEEKQNIDQSSATALNERQSQLTEAETRLLQAERTAAINIIEANNTATIILNQANSDAAIQTKVWQDRADGYSHAKTTLTLNESQIISYINDDNKKTSNTLITV